MTMPSSDRPSGSADFHVIRTWPTSPESSHLSAMFTAIRKATAIPREHPDDARRFFDDVARRLDDIDSVS